MSGKQPLKIELGHHGSRSHVWIDGVDISRYLTGVRVEAEANGVTTATLEYTGAVVITGDVGQLELKQATHYVECQSCHKAIQGAPVEVKLIDRTGMGETSKQWEIVRDQDGNAVVYGAQQQ